MSDPNALPSRQVFADDVTSLVTLVYEMRQYQRSYFASRKQGGTGSREMLEAAKGKERAVDSAIAGFRSRGFGPPESTGERRG